MSETLASSLSNAEKRRTTRVAKRVPITVTGIDALGQPFKVDTQTVSVSCHGWKYRSKHYVPKHSIVTIEISCLGLPLRIVSGRVVSVQRPRSVRQEFEIGLEFDMPQDVWGIELPPEDWLPFCKDQTATVPALDATTVPDVKVPAPGESSGLASARTDSLGQIETTIYDMTSLQAESWDAQLRETIERVVEKSIARISELVVTRVVQQVAGPLVAAIAEKVCQKITDKLDVRIEKIVQEAVSRERIEAIRSCSRGEPECVAKSDAV
jgi:hypothetical protein